MTTTLSVGDLLTSDQVSDAPAGVTLVRTPFGWEVTEIPEVQISERDALAYQLYKVYFPATSTVAGDFSGGRWGSLADYVTSNFTRNTELSPVFDGDGDEWKQVAPDRYTFVCTGGSLSTTAEMSNLTREQLRAEYGPLRGDTEPPAEVVDGYGDTWVLQPDQTYRVRFSDGKMSGLYVGYSLERIRVEFKIRGE